MGKIDTVAGIERTAILRNPNGVQCDGCGVIVNLSRRTYKQELDALRHEGWTINSGLDSMDRGAALRAEYDPPAFDYCPECANAN